MLQRFRKNMFCIGILMFSLTAFAEHLFIGETNATCFLKGLSCGLQLVGVIILIKKNKK